MQRRNIYPGQARVGQKFEKNLETVAQRPKYPIPDFKTLRDDSISLYITKI